MDIELSAADVIEQVFSTSRKGYDKDEVDAFLERVVRQLSQYESAGAGAFGAGAAAGGVAGAGAVAGADAGAAPGAGAGVGADPWGGAGAVSADPNGAAAEPAGSDAWPPGWYADPWHEMAERYFDGTDWTQQVRDGA